MHVSSGKDNCWSQWLADELRTGVSLGQRLADVIRTGVGLGRRLSDKIRQAESLVFSERPPSTGVDDIRKPRLFISFGLLETMSLANISGQQGCH